MNITLKYDFLVSLLRIGRPGVVFKFWGNVTLSYSFFPDVITVNILLRCTLLTVKVGKA